MENEPTSQPGMDLAPEPVWEPVWEPVSEPEPACKPEPAWVSEPNGLQPRYQSESGPHLSKPRTRTGWDLSTGCTNGTSGATATGEPRTEPNPGKGNNETGMPGRNNEGNSDSYRNHIKRGGENNGGKNEGKGYEVTKLVSLNIRGLISQKCCKVPFLNDFVKEDNVSVLCLQETWNKQEYTPS